MFGIFGHFLAKTFILERYSMATLNNSFVTATSGRNGGTGNDTFTGLSASGDLGDNDIFYGLGGNDNINGGLGDDYLDGGDGNDIVGGGKGNDTVLGGAGNDTIRGGFGDDQLMGGLGDDVIDESKDTDSGSADALLTRGGNNLIAGNQGNDSLYGGGGTDSVQGGQGNDLLLGNGGNDIINAGQGNDTVYGGIGDDVIQLANNIGTSFSGGLENLFGGNQNISAEEFAMLSEQHRDTVLVNINDNISDGNDTIRSFGLEDKIQLINYGSALNVGHSATTLNPDTAGSLTHGAPSGQALNDLIREILATGTPSLKFNDQSIPAVTYTLPNGSTITVDRALRAEDFVGYTPPTDLLNGVEATLSLTEDDNCTPTGVLIDGGVTVADTDYEGGSLSVSFLNNDDSSNTDGVGKIALTNTDGTGGNLPLWRLSGSGVVYTAGTTRESDDVVIGTSSGALTGADSLTIDFNENATAAHIEHIIESLKVYGVDDGTGTQISITLESADGRSNTSVIDVTVDPLNALAFRNLDGDNKLVDTRTETLTRLDVGQDASTNLETLDYSGNVVLTVSIAAVDRKIGDKLGVVNSDGATHISGLKVVGNRILRDGVVIATTSGGTGTDDLVITFDRSRYAGNDADYKTVIDTVLKAVGLDAAEATEDDLGTTGINESYPTDGERTIHFKLAAGRYSTETDVIASVASSYTLTLGTDDGTNDGTGFAGTAGLDVFLGSGGTLNSSDNINGGGGTGDSLVVTLTDKLVTPTIGGIETFELTVNGTGALSFEHITGVESVKVLGTGQVNLQNADVDTEFDFSGFNGDVTLSITSDGSGTNQAIVTGAGNDTVQLDASSLDLSGINVNLGASTGDVLELDIGSNGVTDILQPKVQGAETIAIADAGTGGGSVNVYGTNATGVQTITIERDANASGNASTVLLSSFDGVTTVDASGNANHVEWSRNSDDASGITFIGGTGGFDTLSINSTGIDMTNDTLQDVEYIKLTAGSQTVNVKVNTELASQNGLWLEEISATGNVTLADAAAHLSGLLGTGNLSSALDRWNVDHIDVLGSTGQDSNESLTIGQTAANTIVIGNAAFVDADIITVDLGTGTATASQLADYAEANIDLVHSASGFTLNVTDGRTLLDYDALGQTGGNATGAKIAFTDDSTGLDSNEVVLLDTGANIGNLTTGEIAQLGDDGVEVDVIRSSSGDLVMNMAQINAVVDADILLDASGEDKVIARDTSANLQTLTTGDIAAWGSDSGAGVVEIDATDDVLAIDIAQALALDDANITANTGDVVTLLDSIEAIAAMATSTGSDTLAELVKDVYIDQLNASTDTGNTLSIEAADAIAAIDLDSTNTGVIEHISFASGDDISLTGNADDMASITAADLSGYAAIGIDTIDLGQSGTGADVSFDINKGQADAVVAGNMEFAQADTVTLQLGNDFTGILTGSDISGYIDANIDVIDGAGVGDIVLTVAQARQLLNNTSGSITHKIHFGDVVNVRIEDSAANIGSVNGTGGLTAAELNAVGSGGVNVDSIESTGLNEDLNLSVAQVNAANSGGIIFDTNDTGSLVVLQDTETNIDAMKTDAINALGNVIDAIDDIEPNLTGTTFDDSDYITLDASLVNAFNNAGITFKDQWVYLQDTAANAHEKDFSTVQNIDGADISASDGAQSITGTVGADTIRGGMGADTIIGGAGKDILSGNSASSTPSAGGDQASDIFVFGTGDAGSTSGLTPDVLDTITDFESFYDKIDLTAFGPMVFIAGNGDNFYAQTQAGIASFRYNRTLGDTYIEIDGNGDNLLTNTADGDFRFKMTGQSFALTESDFIYKKIYTFTTSVDTLYGEGASPGNTTGNTSDDRFVSSEGTLQTTDKVFAGAGTDTLYATLAENLGMVGTVTNPQLTSIEVLNLNAAGSAKLNLAKSQDLTNINVNLLAEGETLTLNNISTGSGSIALDLTSNDGDDNTSVDGGIIDLYFGNRSNFSGVTIAGDSGEFSTVNVHLGNSSGSNVDITGLSASGFTNVDSIKFTGTLTVNANQLDKSGTYNGIHLESEGTGKDTLIIKGDFGDLDDKDVNDYGLSSGDVLVFDDESGDTIEMSLKSALDFGSGNLTGNVDLKFGADDTLHLTGDSLDSYYTLADFTGVNGNLLLLNQVIQNTGDDTLVLDASDNTVTITFEAAKSIDDSSMARVVAFGDDDLITIHNTGAFGIGTDYASDFDGLGGSGIVLENTGAGSYHGSVNLSHVDDLASGNISFSQATGSDGKAVEVVGDFSGTGIDYGSGFDGLGGTGVVLNDSDDTGYLSAQQIADMVSNGSGKVVFDSSDTIVISNTGNEVSSLSGVYDQAHIGGAKIVFYGGTGNETVQGGSGADTLYGGSGADTLYGGDGNDTLVLLRGDVADGGSGADVFEIADTSTGPNSAAITINNYSTAEGDIIDLTTLADYNTFNLLDLEVRHGTGLNSGDLMVEFLGESTTGLQLVIEDASGDTVTFQVQEGSVRGFTSMIGEIEIMRVNITEGGTLTGSVSTSAYNPTGGELLVGGDGAQTINGGDGDDILNGMDGSDSLNGGAGDDTLLATRGDTLTGGTGNDVFAIADTSTGTNEFITITDYTAGDDIIDLTFLTDYGTFDLSKLGVRSDGSGGLNVEFLGENNTGLQLHLENAGNQTVEFHIQDNGSNSAFGLNGIDTMLVNITGSFSGGIDAELLVGGDGAQSIYGGDGNDILMGGAGIDHLDGGSGADVFVFGSGDSNGFTFMDYSGASSTIDNGDIYQASGNSEFDVIHNFTDNLDKVWIQNGASMTLGSAPAVTSGIDPAFDHLYTIKGLKLLNGFEVDTDGSDTLVVYNNGSVQAVVLVGITPDNLDASDFINVK